jgi:choline-sulfatase
MSQLTRKQFLSTGAVAAAPPLPGPARAAGRPKNVLLLLSDQHKPRALGIDGDPVARTPHLDALARSGVRFDSAYCTNPVCTPSRASLLTGLYTHRHRAYNNSTPWPFEHKTIADAFRRAGYMTALVGKMHFVDAQTHGFDYRLDFNDWFQYLGPKTRLYAEELGRRNSGSGLPQIDDLWRDYDDPWVGVRELDDREGPVHVGRVSKLAERDHFESFVARESIRFLREHGQRQPFFLLASFLKPHDPFMPAERFARMFRPEDMRLPDTWGQVDLEKVPREIRESIRNNRPTSELRDPEKARQRIACYYANVAQLDDCVGQVLAALRELGLEQDTVVVYASDHGEMLGEHGLWQKFVFYEASVGVPLIFRVPGLTPENARAATVASLVQVSATLGDVCGVPVPSGLDGASFAGCLRDPGRTLDTTVFAEFNLRTPRAKYMLRRGDLKYHFYVGDMAELYNLRADPKEMRNLALLPEYQAKVEEMRAQLFAWYRPPELELKAAPKKKGD